MFLVLNEIKNNCVERKFMIILGAAACVAGIIFAFIFKYDFGGADGAVFILNPNKYVCTVLGDDFSAAKLIFTRTAFGALTLAIVFITGLNSYTVFLSYALIIYKTYSAAFYLKFFVTGFAFHGFIIFVFLVFTECLCLSAAILLLMINCYDCSVCDETFNVKKRLVFFDASLFIVLVFSVYEAAFIAVIARPFNLLIIV